jgi:hypothetical protein
MKFLQVIIILCGLVGGAFGLDLLFRLQPGRDGENTSSTLEVSRPRLDENGEPMR